MEAISQGTAEYWMEKWRQGLAEYLLTEMSFGVGWGHKECRWWYSLMISFKCVFDPRNNECVFDPLNNDINGSCFWWYCRRLWNFTPPRNNCIYRYVIVQSKSIIILYYHQSPVIQNDCFFNFVLHTDSLSGFFLSLQMTIPNKSLIYPRNRT